MKLDKTPKNINHHSGFVSGLEVLLWPYRDQIDIKPEQWLAPQGIRIDVLIVKKEAGVDIDFDIARIFSDYNIIEFKRLDDDLDIDVYAKVMAYANLFKSLGKTVDSVSYSSISATIYRHACPRDAFKKLESLGATVEMKYPGVYYVYGNQFFPVQILVGRQLDPKEYAMFKVLVPGASDDEIRKFNDIAVQNKDAAYQKSVDNIFQVSVSANRESYARLLKEDPAMCDALRELMREDFIETEKMAEERGANKLAALIRKLNSLGRNDDVEKALDDDKYRDKLFKEFQKELEPVTLAN